MSEPLCTPRVFFLETFELPEESPPCYRGHRNNDGPNTVLDPSCRVVPPYHHVRNHSPAGFEWGYGGSGPAQLALALLIDFLKTDADKHAKIRALAWYQDFKWEVVSRLPAQWALPVSEIRRWINARPWEGPEQLGQENGHCTD